MSITPARNFMFVQLMSTDMISADLRYIRIRENDENCIVLVCLPKDENEDLRTIRLTHSLDNKHPVDSNLCSRVHFVSVAVVVVISVLFVLFFGRYISCNFCAVPLGLLLCYILVSVYCFITINRESDWLYDKVDTLLMMLIAAHQLIQQL